MESNKTASETLGEGYVESKLILCNNLSEDCTADVYSGLCEISHVELSSKLGHISLEESVVFDEIAGNNQKNQGSLEIESLVCNSVAANNQINKGSLSNFSDNKMSVSVDVNSINNDVLLVSKGELKDSVNDVKVEEHVAKNDDYVLHPHQPCSPTKIEVSGNNMNLFVDVFGPSDEISKSDQEYPLEENPTKNEGEEEHTFDVGDLVWVKTRTQLWWPGIISDPNKSNDAAKYEKGGSFFVKLFGNIHSIWCNNSCLKPFVENFEQMSAQNNSRNFFGSVEKALSEFSHRVKTKMTCPCFSNDDQNLGQSRVKTENKKSKSDALSLSRFDPASFSARIRNLACSVGAPGKIELTLMKISMSSFYCSVGHCQLPLHLLKSSNDTSEIVDEGLNKASRSFRKPREAHDGDVTVGKRRKRNENGDDNVATSGKFSESRERKKSKYLSYPYIDVKNAVSNLGTKPEDPIKNSSSPSKKSDDRKKGSKKSRKGNHVISKEDDIDACSAELLQELCFTARDCFYLGGSKYSDSLKRFYGSFRMYTFGNADIACKDGGESNEVQLKVDNPEAKGTVVKKKAKKKKENSPEANEVQTKTDNLEANGSVAKKGAKKKKEKPAEGDELQIKTDNPEEAKGSVVKKRAKKKKEKSLSAVLESTIKYSDLDTTFYPNGSCMISFQQTPSDVSKSSTISKKTEEKTTTPLLPDIDLNVQTSPCGEASTNLGKNVPEQKIEELASPNIIAFEQSKDCSNEQSNVGELSLFVRPPLQLEIFPSAEKTECKKRKRKEKNSSDIPDLNGTLSPEGNHTSTEEKIEKKRVVNKVEDPGGSLLLSFGQGIDLPSKETLVATFSRFGLLKESEIQVIDDSSVEIVYERSSEARFAYRSLEKSSSALFGESLTGFKLNGVPLLLPARVKNKEKKSRPNKVVTKPRVMMNNACKNGNNIDNNNRPPPDMSFMRQNVEKMKMMLEKAGDSLSPEMRAKLEDEIRVFLEKISSVGGGSSSS